MYCYLLLSSSDLIYKVHETYTVKPLIRFLYPKVLKMSPEQISMLLGLTIHLLSIAFRKLYLIGKFMVTCNINSRHQKFQLSPREQLGVDFN